MNPDTLIFRVIAPDGHEYRVYANGNTEGFPVESMVINHFYPLFQSMQRNPGAEA